MQITRQFKLDKAARKSGGDKYAELTPTGERPIMEFTYVNQSVSRPAGSTQPVPVLVITVDNLLP